MGASPPKSPNLQNITLFYFIVLEHQGHHKNMTNLAGFIKQRHWIIGSVPASCARGPGFESLSGHSIFSFLKSYLFHF
jgi:hypothetical protein